MNGSSTEHTGREERLFYFILRELSGISETANRTSALIAGIRFL